MKKVLEILLMILVAIGLLTICSCQAEDDPLGSGACLLGDCKTVLEIDLSSQPDAYLDENGYWHIKYYGVPYFSVKARFSPLKNRHVRSTIPMIKSTWDSSVWYIPGEISLWSSSYSPFGDFTNNFSYAIANNTYQIVIPRLDEINEIMNISGRYMRNGIMGPRTSTHSTPTYYTKQPMMLSRDMVGDTIQVWNESYFAYDSSQMEEILTTIDIIIE